jgi:hypothetical protein
VAGYLVAGFYNAQQGLIFPAARRGNRAARVEAATGWRVRRAGKVAFKQENLALRLELRVRHRYGGE